MTSSPRSAPHRAGHVPARRARDRAAPPASTSNPADRPTQHTDTAPPASPGSQAGLRVANRRRVLDAVRSAGAVTQAGIARETALAPSTVSAIVKELTACDLLVAAPEHGGRRGQRIRFSPGAGHLLGVDVGHRHVEVAVADLNLELHARRRIDLPGEHRAEEVMHTVRETARELLEQLGTDPGRVLHAGLTLPAPVPTGGHGPRTSSILPRWAGTDVQAAAATALGCPVVVENDANAGAVAEHALGAGRGVHDMAYLKVSHGVGAGLVLGGSLYQGAHGWAGEIGHVTLDEGAGLCRCGNRGCLETFVSASAVLDVVATSGQSLHGVTQVVDAALAGDPGCRRVVADTGGLLGGAVAQLCNLLDPELVVVGGDLARTGDLLLEPLLAAARRGTPQGGTRVRAVPSALGADAHLLGALVLARARTPLLAREGSR